MRGLLGWVLLSACHRGDDVDLIVQGGTIHVDGDHTATAMAVRDGCVVGLDEEAAKSEGAATTVVDLGGAHVFPGFQDSHVHLLPGNFALERLLLLGVPSMDAIADAVAEYATETPDEPWIIGYGWLAENITDPTGEPITAVLPDRPALLVSNSGHEAIVNQAALDAAGIDASTPDPEGGAIGRDPETGEPTGYLVEGAVSLIADFVLAAYDDERISIGLSERLTEFSAGGLTAVQEILAAPGLDIGRPWIYADLEAAGELPLRITWYAAIFSIDDVNKAAEQRDDYEGDLVRFGGGKVWVDGSMGSAQAWVEEPYLDDEGTTGTSFFLPETLTAIVAEAENVGIPLKLHVNGDAAVDEALDALEAVANERGGLSQTHVLEHVVLLDDEDLARLSMLGLLASVQPTHYLPSSLGESAELLGDERFAEAYDFRELLDAGVTVAVGTDWPVWPSADPILVTWNAAQTRGEEKGFTLAEAMRGYTEGSAATIGRGDELGRLDVGYLADFVVLDKDPQAVEIADVPGIEVKSVWVGGVQVK